MTHTGYITVLSDGNGMAIQPPGMDALAIGVQTLSTDSMGITETMITEVSSQPAAPVLMVAPNPTTGEVGIQYAQGLTRIWLLDAVGRRVGEWQMNGASFVLLDLNSLSSGSYMFIVTDTMGKLHNRKVIKQ